MTDDKVVSLADARSARTETKPEVVITGEVKCMACAHTWEAERPPGTYVFQCPACSCVKGVAAGFIRSEHVQWSCGECNSQLFVIPWRITNAEPYIMCVNCGHVQPPWSEICSP